MVGVLRPSPAMAGIGSPRGDGLTPAFTLMVAVIVRHGMPE